LTGLRCRECSTWQTFFSRSMIVSMIARLRSSSLSEQRHQAVPHVRLGAGDQPQAAGEQPAEQVPADVPLVPDEPAEQVGSQGVDGLAVVDVAGGEAQVQQLPPGR